MSSAFDSLKINFTENMIRYKLFTNIQSFLPQSR